MAMIGGQIGGGDVVFGASWRGWTVFEDTFGGDGANLEFLRPQE